jgi:exopolysaccharide production protein ExoZ
MTALRTSFARFGAHFELGDHNRRLSSMEGMRGLAILLVFACHYYGIIGQQLTLPTSFAAASTGFSLAAASGVDLFFLLSGFLIYRSALKHNLNYLGFMRRRFERIYPTFFAVFLIYLVFIALHLTPSRIPTGFVDGARYLAANLLFLPGMFDIQALISAAWSLSYEWTFYLAIPLIVHAFQLHRWARPSRMIFFAVLATVWILAVYIFGGSFPRFAWYDGTHVRMVMFVAGILVYECLDSIRIRSLITKTVEYVLLAIAVLCAITILIMCLMRATPAVDGEWTVITGALQILPTFFGCAALGLLVLRHDGLLAKLFSVDWLRWTGNISYSFYLMHSVPMHVIAVLIKHGPLTAINPLLLYALTLPITVALVYACSIALFICIERPLSLRPRRTTQVLATQQAVA